MKQSKLFVPTEKEVPADATVNSHIYMLRGGFIRQVAGGIYSYLPLADRIINKIEAIIRQELNSIDANEMMMPEMIPAELWKQSGRYYTYGPLMYRLRDRHGRDFLMGPTHEESFARLIADEIKSYKKLPLILYQIREKFRDELRPKNGLLRAREFIMQDAYSFSADEKGLDDAYQQIKKAYERIFNKIGLNYREIIADAGAMGGKASTEFQAVASTGEDVIAYSDKGDYAANIEMAEEYFKKVVSKDPFEVLKIVDTPNSRTVAEDASFLRVDEHKIAKTIVFKADDKIVAVTVPGDYEVNEVKVKNFINAGEIDEADEETVFNNFGAHFGYLGPVGVDTSKIDLLIDRTLFNESNWFVGANRDDKHFANFNPARDLDHYQIGDFITVKEGNPAPDGGKLRFTKGIEIGHIFKLGTFYTSKMGGQIQNSDGKVSDIIMGSYGIGISRLLSAIAEQSSDEKGFIWPKSIAPYQIHLIVMKEKDPVQHELAAKIDHELEETGYEVLIDDRSERPGVKFADSDLIGIPIRIVVGRDSVQGKVEVKARSDEESKIVDSKDLKDFVENKLSVLK
ncbi:proline--tRNA ligase [Oenococcus alcoholitolerans]|uniref:proline--tRNA ligase n=1 Tax=Oenococcus alcoholitolerans TaxID=931074 RepID=UPI003F6E6214